MRILSKTWTRHLLTTAIAFAVVGFLAVAVLNISFLNPIGRALKNFSIIDLYFQMLAETATRPTSRIITIVDMTELNLRRDIADVIENIEKYHPAAVGIDIIFEGIKEDTIGDNRIMDQAELYRNTVYSFKLHRDTDGHEHETHSFFTPFIPVNEGVVNFQRDLYSGVKRYMQSGMRCGKDLKPTFVSQVASGFARQPVAKLSDKPILINYTPKHYEQIRYDSVMAHPELIENRIVLVAATKEESDMHYTPLGKMPGAELQAYAIDMLINKSYIRELPHALLITVTILLVLLMEYIQHLFRQRVAKIHRSVPRFLLSTEISISIVTFFFMAIFLFLSFQILHRTGWYVNLSLTFSAMAFLDISRQFYDTCLHIANSRAS